MSECILWTGAKDHKGYGRRTVQRRTWAAHRYAFFVATGIDPRGFFVCHSCDIRACVNPEHLWLGTARDNTADMMAKGRHRVSPPEKHRSVRLTWEKVEAIRSRSAAGEGYRALAREFGVDHKTVRKAVLGLTWRSPDDRQHQRLAKG